MILVGIGDSGSVGVPGQFRPNLAVAGAILEANSRKKIAFVSLELWPDGCAWILGM